MAYSAAVFTSVSVAMSLRIVTKPLASQAVGLRYILINTFIATMANISANYINPTIMRHPETISGIKVFKS